MSWFLIKTKLMNGKNGEQGSNTGTKRSGHRHSWFLKPDLQDMDERSQNEGLAQIIVHTMGQTFFAVTVHGQGGQGNDWERATSTISQLPRKRT